MITICLYCRKVTYFWEHNNFCEKCGLAICLHCRKKKDNYFLCQRCERGEES